jgi:AraC-like DNA-binding protein
MVILQRGVSRTDADTMERLDENESLIQSAVDFINESFKSDISLDTVSKKVSLSRSFFSRKFKEITGFGFSEYLNLVRIKHAAEALSVSDVSVTEAALDAGFNDSSYFCSVFKRLMGETPYKYAARMRRDTVI